MGYRDPPNQPQSGVNRRGARSRRLAARRAVVVVKLRRRPRREGGGRAHRVTVRLDEQEYARVYARANACGLTVASYLAEIGRAARPGLVPGAPIADSPPVGDAVTAGGEAAGAGEGLLVERGRPYSVLERRAIAAELFAVRRLLSGIGTNLNQLARVANSTGQVPAQVPATAAAVERYVARLGALATALDPRVGR